MPRKSKNPRPTKPPRQFKLSELLKQRMGKNPHRELIRGRRGKEVF